MSEYFFKVAELPVTVSVPAGVDLLALLPNMRPFAGAPGETVMRIAVEETDATRGQADAPGCVPTMWRLTDDSVSDLGRVRLFVKGTLRHNRMAAPMCNPTVMPEVESAEYLFVVEDDAGSEHRMLTDRRFERCVAEVDFSSRRADQALDSLIRIAFSQAVLLHGGVSVHASAVVNRGAGYMFLGASGTGKSTHSRLWMEHIAGTELLNDDNPILRRGADGEWRVYGSPWSGKTPCYKQKSASLRSVTRLRQAPQSRYRLCAGAGAFRTLLPSCSAIKQSAELFGALCRTLSELAADVQVGELDATMGPEAAREVILNLEF